jgi:2-iminobutanoate/2-iminopropanoate deaminase
MKKTILTKEAPEPIGPYSQAVKTAGLIFISGQIGLDPKNMQMAEGCQAQAAQIFENMKAILQAADANLADVIKLTIFLTNLNDFELVNNLMRQIFEAPFPARSTIEVSKLPRGALVEIEAIAISRHE